MNGLPVKAWSRIFANDDDAVIEAALKKHLGLK